MERAEEDEGRGLGADIEEEATPLLSAVLTVGRSVCQGRLCEGSLKALVEVEGSMSGQDDWRGKQK